MVCSFIISINPNHGFSFLSYLVNPNHGFSFIISIMKIEKNKHELNLIRYPSQFYFNFIWKPEKDQKYAETDRKIEETEQEMKFVYFFWKTETDQKYAGTIRKKEATH